MRRTPYFGSKSGLKKKKPKKKGVGIEYTALATSNKGYEGYKDEIRAEPKEGEIEGKIIRPADPISGGMKMVYRMSGGPKYEFGYTNPSKIFGGMLQLIFMTGGYLRYGNTTVITDSAFGFVEALIFLSLCGLNWVTSFRLGQRRGFLGIPDFQEAYEAELVAKHADKKNKLPSENK